MKSQNVSFEFDFFSYSFTQSSPCTENLNRLIMGTIIQSFSQNNTLVCRDPVPDIQFGIILERTYVPPCITYGCYSGFISEGDKNVIHFIPMRFWETPNISCNISIIFVHLGLHHY